ncbi:hypothetical protein ACJ72_06780 [Emergomyces africanus]|uniref:Uncharacterized protein n=1 Tax=Emergomyces africanus TaxID=1955775 RepID=A0A1B7NQL0_9EURO|nr:hypothetical protein ACJ72_06780 [Emergomyces africanus]
MHWMRGLDFEELESEMGYKMAEELTDEPVNLYDVAEAQYTSVADPGGYTSSGTSNDKKLLPVQCEAWVIRNLTTHEFVRSSAVILDEKHVEGLFINILGYDEVILYKTC